MEDFIKEGGWLIVGIVSGLVLLFLFVGLMSRGVREQRQEADTLFADCLARNNDPIWCRKLTQ